MKIRLLGLLAALVTMVAGAQGPYSIFSPGPTGPVKSNGSFALQQEFNSDIIALWTGSCSASTWLSGSGACSNPVAGSNTQIQYNNSGVFGASSLLTFTPASVLLNIGAGTTPGTFSVGQLDSMVINGVTVPIPGFALNSNIQGVYENHSYVNGVAAGGARYYGVRSEGTITTPAIVVNGDHLSTWYAAGYNGTSYSLGASIMALVDGTPGASAMPTDLDFAVSPAGSQVPTSRLTLKTDGSYAISGSVGTSGQALTSAGAGSPAGWGTPWTTNFANPTASIGLTAVNGVATTAMRSDSSPPLSQSISPTWTGTHTYSAAAPVVVLNATGAAANQKNTVVRLASGGGFNISTATDAAPSTPVTDALTVGRSGSAVSSVTIGNATDNPSYTLAGTGTLTLQSRLIYPPIVCTGGPCNISGIAIGQTAMVFGVSSFNQISNTVLTADNEMVFNNVPTGSYQGQIVTAFSAVGSSGVQVSFNANVYYTAGTLFCSSNIFAGPRNGNPILSCTTGTPLGIQENGIWQVTGGPTSLAMTWAQGTSTASNTTRGPPSSWIITRVN